MNTLKSRYKLMIIAPTCFYYQAALFQALARNPRIDLTVFFCSDEALHSRDAQQMYKTDHDWGLGQSVVEGYNNKWLRNYSPFPSYLKSLFGLINLGVWKEIKNLKPDVVVLMSWMNPTWWIAILACLFLKIPFLYLTDANVKAEESKSRVKSWLKRILLGRILFRRTAGFLCAGTANRELYQFYNVPDRKLVPFAYSWGYDELLRVSRELNPKRDEIRAELGIPRDSFVVLFCGRLSHEKGPFYLLDAFRRLNKRSKALVLVGDGDLKDALQEYVATHNLGSVYFAGFQNRRSVPKFYASADVLVLPSLRDTWGIVVTEALCFALPVITSDQVGASVDLIKEGHNGFTIAVGDVDALAGHLQHLAELPEEERKAMGLNSRRLIEWWSSRNLTEALDQYLDWLKVA